MFMLCAAVGWPKALDPLFYISRVGATLELVLNIVWSALHIVLMAHSVLSHTNKERHVCVQALPPPALVLSKAFLVKNSTVQVEPSAVEISTPAHPNCFSPCLFCLPQVGACYLRHNDFVS